MSIAKIGKDRTYHHIITGKQVDPLDALLERVIDRLNLVIEKVNELEEKIGD